MTTILTVPAFASNATDGSELISGDFFNWVFEAGYHTAAGISSLFNDEICPSAPGLTSNHNFLKRHTTIDGKTGYFYVCEYCGKSAGEVGKEAYDNQVSELPVPGYGSDGSMYVVPTFSVYHLDASQLFGPVVNGGTKSGDSYCLSANLPSIRYELLESSYHSAKTCRYGVSFDYNIPLLCSAELLFSSATYFTSAQSGQLIFVDSFGANYLGEAKTYQANSTFKAILRTSDLSMVKDGNYVLAGNYNILLFT